MAKKMGDRGAISTAGEKETPAEAPAAGPATSDADASRDDVKSELAGTLGKMMRDQQTRLERLRHVQEFLSAPTFLDLTELPLETSDPPEDIEARVRDLDYRIAVLESILGLMRDERAALMRLLGTDDDAGAGPERYADPAAESSGLDPSDAPAGD